ncbi:MAG: hypothetical protein B7X04_00310 [Parcubacteria group bacterium 21-54-25]|nr:MAG: hypothetical protein B7X04_00310 [Parcubacteria group bacterium 21-54-25]HQU07499.1 hypothetical protein [Candidatus Paceibacterota bacterium]
MRPNRDIVIGAGAIVVFIILLVWLLSARVASYSPPSTTSALATSTLPIASTTPATATSTSATRGLGTVTVLPVAGTAHLAANPIPIDARDAITSWALPGTESTTTKAKLQARINTLLADVGTGRYTNFNIYAQIAQNYGFMGNGLQAYRFYVRAAQSDPTAGLPFSSIGDLMVQLGAYHTAYAAYGKSITLQPRVEQFWLAYLRFLAAHEATAPATASIFASAKTATNNAPNVLIAEANWRASTGNITGAITDWKLVRSQAGTGQQQAIDVEIAKLEKQQSS